MHDPHRFLCLSEGPQGKASNQASDIYIAFVRPLLEYGSVLFDDCSALMSDMIEGVQRQAALTITGAYTHTSHINLLKEVGLELLSERRKQAKTVLVYKIQTGLAPEYLRTIILCLENLVSL